MIFYGDYFIKILNTEGVTLIDKIGVDFDTNQHEAIDRNGEGNLVTEVYQAGFLWKGKVLRPARVSVGKLNNDSITKENKQ